MWADTLNSKWRLCEVAGAHQGRLRASVLPEEDEDKERFHRKQKPLWWQLEATVMRKYGI